MRQSSRQDGAGSPAMRVRDPATIFRAAYGCSRGDDARLETRSGRRAFDRPRLQREVVGMPPVGAKRPCDGGVTLAFLTLW